MKKNTSKPSHERTVDLSPHRITVKIRESLDQVKMENPDQDSWEMELEPDDFNFIVGGRKVDQIWFENVLVHRKGTRDAFVEAQNKTQEDLIQEEEEAARVYRVAEESKPGRLQRHPLESRHTTLKKAQE